MSYGLGTANAEQNFPTGSGGGGAFAGKNASAGHNNIQPTLIGYLWQRTA